MTDLGRQIGERAQAAAEDPAPSGLCETGADRVSCIVADPTHRRIYHGGRPVPAQPHLAVVSPLLDLVEQHGEEWARAALARRRGAHEEASAAIRRSQVLLDRIAELLPQQPVQARDIDGDPWFMHGCGAILSAGTNMHEAGCQQGYWRPLFVVGGPVPEQPAQPDPMVLRLPEVPEGTVALIGEQLGYRWTWHESSGGWCSPERGPISLGRLLTVEGTVRVELAPPREPRTWPKLDGDPDGVTAVRGASGQVYRAGRGGWRPDDDSAWCDSFASLQNYDGPLTEVLDEPDGAP